MKTTLTALTLLAVSSTAGAGCNLPNIKGVWGFGMTGQDGSVTFNSQCAATVASVRGNAKQAPLSGVCLDLWNGFYSVIQPGSWIGFVGKTCQMQGAITLTEFSSRLSSVPLGNLTLILNGEVTNNKKGLSAQWYTSAPAPSWWLIGQTPSPGLIPFSGIMTGSKGVSLQPLASYIGNPAAFSVWPYVPTAPEGAGGNENGNGNGNGKGGGNDCPGQSCEQHGNNNK